MPSESMLKTWLIAARPKTLPAGAVPVVMGAALAHGDGLFHLPSALCALIGALCIQVGTNFANDYFDFVKGADTAERVGPVRAVNAGLVSPRAMALATAVALALAFVPGAYLVYRGGAPILAIGAASVVCAVLYTGGPYPLGYLGLGDLFVLVFFGPVAVAGTYLVQAQHVDALPIIAGIAPGLISTALLAVNNLRDAGGDAKAGKRTLAVRFGEGFARFEYAAAIAIATLAVPLYLVLVSWDHWGALAGCLALVPGLRAIRRVYTETGPALNAVLGDTGRVLVVFGALFSLGWALT